MALDIVSAAVGLVVLVLAGDTLVKGAVNLSLRLGVPALIVSLTVVAFGTSAPELFISVNAVLRHAPGIALGNVVGSNIANILLVLGVPALMAGFATSREWPRKSYLHMMLATLLFVALAFFAPIGWADGLVLLAALALILADALHEARGHRRAAREAAEFAEATTDLEGADPAMPAWRVALYTVLGLVGLPLGANLLVESAVDIATHLGVSESVIGLTMVALGTSLPELATTVMAALRRQADVALGNVLGSNMFNLLAVIGTASLFGAIPVDASFLRLDLWAMLLASAILAPFVFGRADMTRPVGAALTALYAAYVIFLFS